MTRSWHRHFALANSHPRAHHAGERALKAMQRRYASRRVWFVACCALAGCGTGSGGASQPSAATASKPTAEAAPTQPNTPAAAEPTVERGPKIAFLGDSISAGLHLAADAAFPARVHALLAARGVRFELVNAGVSGDTSAGGLRRSDWLLKQAPAIVVIELGANDGLRGQPIAEIEQNLRAIVDKVRARGATPLLLGMRIPPSYGAEYSEAFATLYSRVAHAMQVEFVPFFMDGVAGVPELNLPDGLHPTAQGHERLAARVVEPLAQLIAKLP